MRGAEFKQDLFEANLEAFEAFFHTDSFTYRFFAPITGLKVEVDRVELEPKLAIVRVTGEEKEDLLAEYPTFYPSNSTAITHEFALELFHTVPKIIAGDDYRPSFTEHPVEAVKRKFAEVCSALRLFKAGALALNHVWILNTIFPLEGFGATHNPYSPPRFFDSYTLSSSEANALATFWQQYQASCQVKRKRFEVALRRFNFAYERERPEDKLIDYMIALEALLLGDQQELKYKLAMRGAALLGNSPDERKRIYDELGEAYNQRSKTVHGDIPKKQITIGTNQLFFDELVGRVEEHTRSAIKRFLSLSANQKEEEIIKALDEQLVRGSVENKASI
jgi:hypothetical protein